MADANGDTAVAQPNGHTNSPSAPAATSASAPTPAPLPSSASAPALPNQAMTSLQDDGTSRRPRDARLIHMLLSALGVSAYQERVPLQLLDFAYRHTSSILSDAVALSPDTMIPTKTGGGSKADKDKDKDRPDDAQINMNAIHFAIAGRLAYQFHGGGGAAAGVGGAGGLAKEFLLEMAEKRNAQALPKVFPNEWGVRLPSERFVLTGVPWNLRDAWEPGEDDEDIFGMAVEGVNGDAMVGMEMDEGDEEGGRMEDIFGEGEPEDIEMAEE